MRSSLGLLVDISITMYMEELETKLDAGTVWKFWGPRWQNIMRPLNIIFLQAYVTIFLASTMVDSNTVSRNEEH